MVARTLYVIDSEALTVLYSTRQAVGDTVINNSDSPNGTQYAFNSGFSTQAVTIEDTGGDPDILEDDNHTSHVVTDGAGLVANGTGVEAESVIQLQEISASGTPVGPVINIYVLSQNGNTGDVWGFASDTALIPGTNYQKVGGGNIGTTSYSNFQTPWLVTVDGTAGNDVMNVGYTDLQGDQIDGSDGTNEAIYGYGGDDSITAGAGSDTLVGGTGADTLDGGAGVDVAGYRGSTGAVNVNLATGTGTGGEAQGDTLTNIENVDGSDHDDTLTGDGNANVLRGGKGNDTITGGAGNDTLVGGAGADVLDGGAGSDMADYSTSGSAVTVNLTTGTGTGGDAQGDTLTNIEDLTGSGYNDSLTGDGNANVLIGGAGNDNLRGEAGNDTLLGGAGNDTLTGGTGADSLDGGTGIDRANYSASTAAVTVSLATGTGSGGSAQGDTLANIENLTGSVHNDHLTGDANANAIDGGGGADTLVGGAGNDTLTGGAGGDSLDGGAGNDGADYSASNAAVQVSLATGIGTGGHAQGDTLTGVENLTGSAFGDTLTGDANANVLRGLGGNDTITGGAGNDTVEGGLGADSLDGGTGVDTADYRTSNAGVTVNLTTGTGIGGHAQGDTLTGFENIWGSNYNDILTGDSNANLLSGGYGSDSLDGGAGVDTLQGGAGSDTLVGGAGADQLDGGSGYDTADYSGSASGVTVNLTTGTGTGGDAQGDTLVSVENITGSNSDDLLTGAATANALSGGAGNDTLDGGAGNDTLDGGAGSDRLVGGAGDDSMTGGAGDDVFVLADGSGADTITDFDIGDSDGDGYYNDQFDVSNLTDSNGDPVNAWDITVSDDGFGNALLSFPNGETVRMQGVAPSQINTSQMLISSGVPCFTDGTLISTQRGEIPVEALKVGDKVHTLDNGLQPIRWIGSRTLGPRELLANPTIRPVLIPEGTCGAHTPLFVSPLHGMLVDTDSTVGGTAFARAKHLAEAKGPVRIAHGKKRVTYFHLMFDSHQVIFANGAASESFYPGEYALQMFSDDVVKELELVIPGFSEMPVEQAYGASARPYMKRREVLDGLVLRQELARRAV